MNAATFKLTTTATRSIELVVPSFVPGEHGRRTELHITRATDAALAGIDTSPEHVVETSEIVLDRLVAATAVHID